MKHKTVFGVGTARYMGLTLPHFVDEDDHSHDHFVVDSPLCCGIVRWDIRDKVRHHYIHAHSDSITCLVAVKRVPYIKETPKIVPQMTLSASFGGELATWDQHNWAKLDQGNARLAKVMHMSVNYQGNKVCLTSEESGGLISVFSLSPEGKLKLLYDISGEYLCGEFNKKDNIVAIVQTKLNNQNDVKIVELDLEGKTLNTTPLEGHLEVNMLKRNENGLIAIARGKRIDVIDADTLQVVWVTQPQVSGWIKDFLFYENDLIIPSDRGTLVLWRKTEQVKVWEVSCSMVFSLAWSKKGKTIWMGDESGIHYIDLENIKGTMNVMYHEMTCCGVDFSYSGDLIACGDFGGQVLVWDFNTHKPVHSIRLGLPVRSISWRGSQSVSSLSDPIVIGLMDGSVYSWILKQNEDSPSEPKLIASLKDGVTSLSWEYSPSPSLLAAGSIDGSFSIFKYDPNTTEFNLHSCVMAHKPADKVNDDFGSLHKFAEIWSLCWSPDNKFIATASEDQKTRIWNVETGEQVTELCGHTSAVTCVDWQITKIGNILATCGDDRTIMIWDASTFKLYHTFETKEIDDWHTATYLALEKGGNGSRIVCVTQNGWLMMWDIETKKKLVGKRFHMGSIEGLKWNDQASLLVTCASDCAINVFDVSV